jgi:hypothetical protein
VVLADVNGDGKPDAVSASGNSVSASLNNGDGTMGTTKSFALGTYPAYRVAVGDFNGDGASDVAVAFNSADTGFEVLLGNGDGTLQSPVTINLRYAASLMPIKALQVADLNSDGLADLLVGYSSEIDPFGGNPTTILSAEPVVTIPQPGGNCSCSSFALAVADLNHDGYPDVVQTGGYAPVDVNVLLGGGGSLSPPIDVLDLYNNDIHPTEVAIGDLDGNGIDDIVVGTEFGDALVLYGQSPTSYSSDLSTRIPTPLGGLAIVASGPGGLPALAVGDQSNQAVELIPGTAAVPAAPTGITATPGNGQALISWQAPANGGAAITGYRVTAYPPSGVPSGRTFSSTATQEAFAPLVNRRRYSFSVAAINVIGISPDSPKSPTVIPAGVPGTPTNVLASSGNTTASVSWTRPAPNGRAITGYSVTWASGSKSCLGTPCTVTGLTNGVSYTFIVTATNSVGIGLPSAPSNSVIPVAMPMWKAIPPMPTARAGLAAAFGLDGQLYAIGGDNGSSYFATVEAYNPQTKVWSERAPMPTARSVLAAVTAPDGRIFAIGGEAYGVLYNTVEAYTPATDSWHTLAPLSIGRDYLAAVVGSDGRIYATGGRAAGNVDVNSVEAYSISSNTWATVPSMSSVRVYLAGAARTQGDKSVYALGGNDGQGLAQNSAERYVPGSSGWNPLPAMSTPRFWLGAAGARDGRIYAVAGSTGSLALNSVEAYSPELGTWSAAPALKTARYGLAVAANPHGQLFAIGGRDQAGNVLATGEFLRPPVIMATRNTSTSVSVSGSSLLPLESVSIYSDSLGGTPLAAGVVDANGWMSSLSLALGGRHTLILVGSNGESAVVIIHG